MNRTTTWTLLGSLLLCIPAAAFISAPDYQDKKDPWKQDDCPYQQEEKWYTEDPPQAFCGEIFEKPDVPTCMDLSVYCIGFSWNGDLYGSESLVKAYEACAEAQKKYADVWQTENCKVKQHQQKQKHYPTEEYKKDCQAIRDLLWQAALALYNGTHYDPVFGGMPIIDSDALADAFNNLGTQPGYASSCGQSDPYAWYSLWCLMYAIVDLEKQFYQLTGQKM